MAWADGVMIGRAAWRAPRLLNALDAMMFGAAAVSEREALTAYLDHMRDRLAEGEPFARLVRPILGLFKGRPGARRYRQLLSSPKALGDNRLAAVLDALAGIDAPAEAPAEAA